MLTPDMIPCVPNQCRTRSCLDPLFLLLQFGLNKFIYDCGEDVGFYPARHKCEQTLCPPLPPIDLPNVLATDVRIKRTQTSRHPLPAALNQWKINRSNSTSAADHWLSSNKRKEEENQESIYYESFAANLPQTTTSKKGLWDRVRSNDKLKQMTPTGKWGQLLDSVSERMQQQKVEEDGPDSDLSDWEGETHVSRVLREYYEKKRQPLPHWLRDESVTKQVSTACCAERSPSQTFYKIPAAQAIRRPSRRRLWEEDPDAVKPRYRRQQQPMVEEHHAPKGDLLDSLYGDYYMQQEHAVTRSKSHHSTTRRAIYF
ncbi:hypothetical protein BX666DRAFT_38439 [Dichotomocladium elegans]|nr:hypothetical protein BX666DRAFT_38439 [Dichotomocladium elegans]